MDFPKYDVAIVGGGAAGLMAAVTAAKNGLKAAVFEKAAAPGGNAVCAGTIFSTAFKDWGDYENDTNIPVLFDTIMKELHYLGNPRLIRRYISRAKDVARYFEEKDMGWVYLGDGAFGIPGSMNVELFRGTTSLGAFLVQEMLADCKALGVEIYGRTPGKRLLTDDAGKVTGVVVESAGEEKCVYAEKVILSCGGAAGTPESIAKYVPRVQAEGDEIRPAGMPTCVGDGIEMCAEIGAETRKDMNIHLLPPWFGGHEYTREGLLMENPQGLLLRKDGRRLMNEAVGFRDILDPVNAAPGKVAYCMYDAEGFQAVWAETSDKACLGEGAQKFAGRINFDVPFEDLETVYAADFKKGNIYKAESLEDAAAFMGADPALLRATVEEYNEAVDSGMDTLFQKDARYLTHGVRRAPFYVMKGIRQVDSTQGGVTVNQWLEPLTPEGKVIEGIYVCGDHVTGFAAEHYYAPGGAGLTFALVSGMLAAEQAAGIRR